MRTRGNAQAKQRDTSCNLPSQRPASVHARRQVTIAVLHRVKQSCTTQSYSCHSYHSYTNYLQCNCFEGLENASKIPSPTAWRKLRHAGLDSTYTCETPNICNTFRASLLLVRLSQVPKKTQTLGKWQPAPCPAVQRSGEARPPTLRSIYGPIRPSHSFPPARGALE